MPLREGRQNSRIRYAVASSFLLTPLREGRLVCMSDWKRFFCTFLLTPLREGRHPRLCHARLVRAISTHAPAGGATYFRLTDDQAKKLISTHAPAGGATERALQEAEGKSYFYSRPCGRGDRRIRTIFVFSCISTHAPAGGATRYPVTASVSELISTHAPAGGATIRGSKKDAVRPYFYSRPCGRGDYSVLLLGTGHQGIRTFRPDLLIGQQCSPTQAEPCVRQSGKRNRLPLIHGRTSLRLREARPRLPAQRRLA